ncbi:hypothetical protein B0H63DRAFT_393780 [Podospora didyma]|uniref:Zn(2)-C6 fungal-type domain-containing protein n=1 Tax=Podospora didyma TaxID=330526 RepID=A0AAE0NQL9_9PEZI|nr:hypothetical protein B0H63DRAFT_393780 [Podospora didyma]
MVLAANNIAAVPRRKKTKTGCRTCKIRRVKCDEDRPACRRCMSTGRVCDGYGIWGGGGNAYGSVERAASSTVHASRQDPSLAKNWTPAVVPGMTNQEKAALDFFRARTAPKLPGVFNSDFWDTLVFQVGFTEPAVLHAIIALAATHRREIGGSWLASSVRNCDDTIPDANERLAMQQYNKAIASLRCHFKKKDRQSVRIALISCMVFISIELLRGDFKTGLVHLQSGLKLLQEIQGEGWPMPSLERTAATIMLQPHPKSVDDYLVEAFTRLNVQSALFGQGFEYLYKVGQGGPSGAEYNIPHVFESMNSARQHLDALINGVYFLSAEINRFTHTHGILQVPHHFGQRKEWLQASLSSWLDAYSSMTSLHYLVSTKVIPKNLVSSIGPPLLRLYHTMATIMAATCLRGTDETVFDSHTADFATILDQAIELWTRAAHVMGIANGCGIRELDISFTIDMGFIPPLYYTALKCRVPRFRRHAIEFLLAAPHREGLWDGSLAAAVAQKVIEIEEMCFYDSMAGVDLNHRDPPTPIPSKVPPLDKLPLIPGSSRVNEVNVLLPEGVGIGRAEMVYKQFIRSGKGGDDEDGEWYIKAIGLDFNASVPRL